MNTPCVFSKLSRRTRWSTSRRVWRTLGVAVACMASLTSCTEPQVEQERQESQLSFSEPRWLTREEASETDVLVGDLNQDGWFDVLMLSAQQEPRVAIARPGLGLNAPVPVAGLPSTGVKQVQLLRVLRDDRAELFMVDDDQQLRQFKSQSASDFEEVEVPIPDSHSTLAFAWGDLDANGWLDVVLVRQTPATLTPKDAGLDAAFAEAGAPEEVPPGLALAVWLRQTDGSFELGGQLHVEASADALQSDKTLLHLADMDSDGDLDIAAVLPGWGAGVIFNHFGPGRETTGNADAATSVLDAGEPKDDSGMQRFDAGTARPSGPMVPSPLRFEAVDVASGGAAQDLGFQLVDQDGDGDTDWYHFTADREVALFINDGTGQFDATASENLPSGARGCVEDFDNDGHPDLLIAGNGELELRSARADSPTAHRAATAPSGVRDVTSLVCVDIDKDGDVDVIASGSQGVALLTNRLDPLLGQGSNFFGFRLEGASGNASALGTRIELSVGGRTQSRTFAGSSQRGTWGSPALHFGFGTASMIERVRLFWPNGEVQETEVPWTVNDVVLVSQPE